ncbi:unnamed protein product [Rotaria socialis]|uniref:G-protein coupled receptors family 1 profile domain-containing protein n=1 Tax=Rotaria socialis TaxID=392032 RepID=A0A817YS07_9BILA|nr:unnamed protein product [Rotaria socialis]CAF4524469.1 unnamed protein product [Rotaria socialis]
MLMIGIFTNYCVRHHVFMEIKFLVFVDWLANTIIPTVSVALANILLLIRVTYRSTRIRHNAERTKNNLIMTIQLLTISALFLVFRLPIAVTGLIQQFFDATFIIDIQFNIFFYLIYLIQLFLPLVCLVSLPELKKTTDMTIIRYGGHRNAISDVPAFYVASFMPAINKRGGSWSRERLLAGKQKNFHSNQIRFFSFHLDFFNSEVNIITFTYLIANK